MNLTLAKSFTVLALMAVLIFGQLPVATEAQETATLFSTGDNGDDRGVTEAEQTIEEIFASRRGGYIKTADNDVAECDINFARFGPLVPTGVSYQESGKPTRYDGTTDPTAKQNPPNAAEPTSIPVHEVGSLLYLNREICLQLKAIRRVQYDLEEKLFVEDPTSRKHAATSIDQAEERFRAVMTAGRAVSPLLTGTGPNASYETNSNSDVVLAMAGLQAADNADSETAPEAVAEGQPNIATNYARERGNARAEAFSVAKEMVTNSGNIHAEEALRTIEKIRSEGLASTITKIDYNRLTSGCQDCTSDEFWDLFIKSKQPNNSLSGSVSMALNLISKKEEQAAEDVMKEIETGNGYLGTRECVGGFNDEGACREWKISSPGSALADMSHRFAYSVFSQAELADKSEEEFVSKDFNFSYRKIFDLANYDSLRDNFGVFRQLDECLDTVSDNLAESRETRPANDTQTAATGLIGSITSDPLSFLNEANLILGNIQDFYSDCIGSLL